MVEKAFRPFDAKTPFAEDHLRGGRLRIWYRARW
jgi:hypothetical protein